VITESEFEKFKVGLEQAKTDCQFVNKQNVLSWQSDAQRYRGELNDLNEKAVGWQEQQKYYTLISPINGSLQNISTINKGEVVFANEKVAEISPDSTLIAVCFLSPSDIGFVHMGQTVHFQIGAYDYNRWGLVNGKVVEISDDVILDVNRQPLFKIKCKLDRPYILLNGRIRGNIKKGMTFNARFRVSDKTIFQLLYDQTDNWINPNTKS
jgi:HlyD family secretion protein